MLLSVAIALEYMMMAIKMGNQIEDFLKKEKNYIMKVVVYQEY